MPPDSAIADRSPSQVKLAERLRARWQQSDRHSWLSLFDQATVSGTSFATAILIKRFGSSKNELALYTLAFSLVLLTVSIMDALVTMPYTVFAPRMKRRERRKYAGSTTVLYVLLSVVAMIALAGGALSTGLGFGPERLSPVLWVMSALMALLLLREFARRMALAHLELKVAVAVDCGSAAVQLVGIVILAWFGILTAATAYAVIAAGCGVVGIVWLIHSRRTIEFCRVNIRESLQRGWDFGRWVLASHVTSVVTLYAMPWLLFLVVGNESAADAIAACVYVLQLSNPFVIGLGNVFAPRSAQAFAIGGYAALQPVVNRNLKLMGGATLLFCTIVALAAPLALRLMFGADMSVYAAPLQVMTLGLLFTVIGLVLDQGLRAMGRPDAAFAANFVALVAALSVAGLLMWRWPVLGGACGVLAGNFAGAAFRAWAYFRLGREHLSAAQTAPQEFETNVVTATR